MNNVVFNKFKLIKTDEFDALFHVLMLFGRQNASYMIYLPKQHGRKITTIT